MTNPLRSFVLCSLFAATALFAGPQQPPPEQPPVQRTAVPLRQRLALSRDQQAQFRAINQDRKAQVNAVQADTSLSPSARRQKIKEIHAAAETKLRGMLNENQLAEYDQIKRERREQGLRNRQTALPPLPPQ
jgi:hypothetical protein